MSRKTDPATEAFIAIHGLLKEREAASILDASPRTLQAWRQRRAGPVYIKLGRCVRYRRSDLAKFAEVRAAAPTVPSRGIR